MQGDNHGDVGMYAPRNSNLLEYLDFLGDVMGRGEQFTSADR